MIFVEMHRLRGRATKNCKVDLRSKCMSTTKLYEWFFDARLWKRYSLFGFEGSNLQNIAPWKLNTSKAKIESIEKKQETIFKWNVVRKHCDVVSLQRKHSREKAICNRSETSKFAKDRLEMLAFTTLYQSKFIWRIRPPTKCEAFWRLCLKGY